MRSQFYQSMQELLPKDEESIFLGSDLGAGTLNDLKEAIGDRFIMEGVSEAHMVTMASGLSSQGFKVYCSTITSFLLRRAYEQIYLDIGCREANVKLMGNGGGLVYAPLGSTHLAIEDISLIKNIPNITIYTPLDKKQLKEMIEFEHQRIGPAYFRIIKGAKKEYFKENYKFKLNEIDVLIENDDQYIFSYGETCHEAYQFIKANNLDVGLVNIPVLRPLALEPIVKIMESSKKILSIEEHIINGSLYGDLLDIKEKRSLNTKIYQWNLPNKKLDHYGNQRDIINNYKMSETVLNFVGRL